MNFDISLIFRKRELESLKQFGGRKRVSTIKKNFSGVKEKEVVFITRINSEKATQLLDFYEDARFYKEANCVVIGENPNKLSTNKKVAIISGGSVI